MRFYNGSTHTTFSYYKIHLVENLRNRKIRQTLLDKSHEDIDIDTDYVLNLRFYDLNGTDKSNLEGFWDNAGSTLVNINNYDEVDSGDSYYTYTGVSIEKPKDITNFKKSVDIKGIENWQASWRVIATGKSTATK